MQIFFLKITVPMLGGTGIFKKQKSTILLTPTILLHLPFPLAQHKNLQPYNRFQKPKNNG